MNHTRIYSYVLEVLSLLTSVSIIADLFIKWTAPFVSYHAPFSTYNQHHKTLQTVANNLSLKTTTLFIVDLISPLLLIIGIYHFIRLLHLYRSAGTIFSLASLNRYTLVCRYALLWTLAGPLSSTLTTLILTMSNPPGKRILEITLQSRDIIHACIVGFVYFVAHIMQEALSIKNEIDLTV